MKIATIIARVLLGLMFVVFGSNIFLHFIPMPPLPATLSRRLLQSAPGKPLHLRRAGVMMAIFDSP